MLSSKKKVIEKFVGFILSNENFSFEFEFTNDGDEKILQNFYMRINKILP